MKKKDLINEIMGVPKALDPLTNSISYKTIELIDEIIKNDKWEASQFTWRGGGEYPMYENSIKLDGRDFTKSIVNDRFGGDLQSYLESKEFTEFPLYNPHLEVELSIIPDDIVEEGGLMDQMEATQGYVGSPSDTKIKNLGGHNIFPNINIRLKVIVPFSYVESRTTEISNKLMGVLQSTVSHELTHAYQIYKQILGGKKGVGFGRETILNMLPQQLKFDETKSWNKFLHVLYLSLSFEVNARVTQLYHELKQKNITTNEEALSEMKKSTIWSDYKMLVDFDADEFINTFEIDLDDDPLAKLMRSAMGIQDREINMDVMRTLINRWDGVIQHVQTNIKKHGITDIPFMEMVPKKAKENPLYFFKFFEKRFHRKGEGLKRKLSKVLSLIVQEGNKSVNESNDFDWVSDIQPMKPEMEFLKDNFDNLEKVIKGDETYYVDSERKPLFMYEQDEENGYVLLSYGRIWSVLVKDFNLKRTEIQELIKDWLGETYNLRGLTPKIEFSISKIGWERPII
jgi:hypothetical protein